MRPRARVCLQTPVGPSPDHADESPLGGGAPGSGGLGGGQNSGGPPGQTRQQADGAPGEPGRRATTGRVRRACPRRRPPAMFLAVLGNPLRLYALSRLNRSPPSAPASDPQADPALAQHMVQHAAVAPGARGRVGRVKPTARVPARTPGSPSIGRLARRALLACLPRVGEGARVDRRCPEGVLGRPSAPRARFPG